MNRIHNILLSIVLLSFAFSNNVFANNVKSDCNNALSNSSHLDIFGAPAAEMLYLDQHIMVGEYSMQITELLESAGHAATGKGQVYIPFLEKMISVQFEEISVDIFGSLMTGEIVGINDHPERPTFQSTESEVLKYYKSTQNTGSLPLLLTSELEAKGMNFKGHDLIMTNLELKEEGAIFNALFMVQNQNGQVTTFSKNAIPLSEGASAFCDMIFPMDGGDQENSDFELPFIIKAFNNGAGTFAAFSCNGLDSFQLVGQYNFDINKLKLHDATLPDRTVKANFNFKITSWGKFIGGVTFNGPFEVEGVDDVVLTVSQVEMDYSDEANPTNDSLVTYLNNPTNFSNANKNDWRGFSIAELSVQLPAGLSLENDTDGNPTRVVFSAQNIIYDRFNGLTATVGLNRASEDTHIASGSLSGWGLSLDTVRIQLYKNSIEDFDLMGDIHIPVTGENDKIGYNASFSKVDGALEAIFTLELDDEYDLPFLDGSKLKMETTSVVGITSVTVAGKTSYNPYANLTGAIDITVGDFTFSALGIQDFQIPTTGISDLTIGAFSFAGKSYTAGPSYSGPATTNNSTPKTTTPDNNTSTTPKQGEKLKGFPISISDISFGDGGTASDGNALKKLGFTLTVNFANEKLGLGAKGDLELYGNIDPIALIPSSDFKPWEAFTYDHLAITQLAVDMDMGGIKLAGGVKAFKTPVPTDVNYDQDYKYGKGFKGALMLTVQPTIEVQAVALFGKTPEENGGFRYWLADAKLVLNAGTPIIPGVLGMYGFGGGAYYNMTQTQPNAIPKNAPDEDPDENAAWALLDNIGESLSGTTYEPYKPDNGDVIGVKAMVVLGTHPNPGSANMDLTLDMAFNTDPFGLHTVSLTGNAYFMAPSIMQRDMAKVTADANIIYNHTLNVLDASLVTEIKMPPMLKGGGTASMHVNFNADQKSDWYIAIGSPPLNPQNYRFNLDFSIADIDAGNLNCYFVAGNVNALPEGQRELPKLSEYHPALSVFQNKVEGMDLSQAMGGYAILMGAQFSLGSEENPIRKEWWIFRANIHATLGFDLMMSQKQCIDDEGELYNIGIEGWYLEGQAYAAVSASMQINVDLFFHSGWYDIASVDAAALLQVKLPNPTWMQGNIAGEYNILGGLVKGNFEEDFEIGTICETVIAPLDPAVLAANIKVISDFKPDDNSQGIPVRQKRLAIASFSIPINEVLDFSLGSGDGLQIRPRLIQNITVKENGQPNTTKGYMKYLNEIGNEVVSNGQFVIAEYLSDALLKVNTNYTNKVQVAWEKRIRNTSGTYDSWEDVFVDGVLFIEEKTQTFTTGAFPETLVDEDILATYPENGAENYCIHENPTGGGISLDQDGWGQLFNPYKIIDNEVYAVDYYLRVTSSVTQENLFQEPLAAIPEPYYQMCIGSEDVIFTPVDCEIAETLPNWMQTMLNAMQDDLGMSCVTVQSDCSGLDSEGNPYAPNQQPSYSATQASNISNVGNMAYDWNYGGSNGIDLAVYYRGISSRINPIRQGYDDRSIGFPDYSHVLEKNKEYRIDIIQIPRISEETYEVDVTTNEEITANNGNSYSVTTIDRAITGDFTGAPPEKIIYTYGFSTGMYDNFLQKLRQVTPSGGSVSTQLLTDLADDHQKLYSPNDFVEGIAPNFTSARTFQKWRNKSTIVNFNLEINEGIDLFESERIARNATFPDAWQEWVDLDKVGTYPSTTAEEFYEWSQIDKDPFYLFRTDKWSNAFRQFTFGLFYFDYYVIDENEPGIIGLETNRKVVFTPPILKGYSGTDFIFYPNTIVAAQWAEALNQFDVNIQFQKYVDKRNELVTTHLDNIPDYTGKLFKLEYAKEGYGKATMNFNAGTDNSYANINGSFYIRNAGTGQYLSNQLSTNDNGTSRRIKAKGTPASFDIFSPSQNSGEYSIGRWAYEKNSLFGEVGSPKAVTDSSFGQSTYFTFNPKEDGTYHISDYLSFTALHLNFNSKGLQNKGYNDNYVSEHRLFYLDPVEGGVQDTPEDLNNTYKIQCKASNRYLYSDINVTGSIDFVDSNEGESSQFVLIRRIDGYYNLVQPRQGYNYMKVGAVFENNQWVYKTEVVISLSDGGANGPRSPDDDHFRFEIIKQTDNSYHIKNKKSEEYLYENFDLDFGPEHSQLLSSASPLESNYAKFNLKSKRYFVVPQDLSGQYSIKVKGSNRYLADSEAILSTSIQANTNANLFVLKRVQGDDRYELWNIETGRRLHYQSGIGLSSELVSGLENIHFQFTLSNINDNLYTIQYASNGNFLFEHFDVNGQEQIRIGNDTPLNDDYYFYLEDSATPSTENGDILTGEYYIRNKDNGRYLRSNSDNQINPDFAEWQNGLSKFSIRNRSGSLYEIWSTEGDKQRLYAKNNSQDFAFGISSIPGNYLFNITLNNDDSYTIQHVNSNQLLFEHFEPNNEAEHHQLHANINIENHYTRFIFDATLGTTSEEDLSGKRFLQVAASGKHLKTKPDGSISSGHSSSKYSLRQQAGGIYKIQNIANGQWLHAKLADGKWTYESSISTDIPDNYYQFRFLPVGSGFPNLYKIQCEANYNYLHVNFNLNQNAIDHNQLKGNLQEPDDYGFFYVKTDFASPPENLSGEYLIKVKESNRYIQCQDVSEGGLLSTESQAIDDYLRFVLKRRFGGNYELWNKGNSLRLHVEETSPTIWQLNTTEVPNLSEEHFLYSIVTTHPNEYSIRNIIFNDKYLHEGSSNRNLSLNSNASTFTLEKNYILPTDLSGEYFIRSLASGRYLYEAGDQFNTTEVIDDDRSRFFLENQGDNKYKIKSKNSGEYLHLNAQGGYSTTVNNDLADNYYLFDLSYDPSNAAYRLKNEANNEYLYEYFDLNFGDQHRRIIGAPNPDISYSYFLLESAYELPPTDISGEYFIQLNSNDRHFSVDGNGTLITSAPVLDKNNIRFMLKRNAEGKYELWNKENMSRMGSLGTGLGFATLSSNASAYWFDFQQSEDGVYEIIDMEGKGLFENSNQAITSQDQTTIDNKFRLETNFELNEDYSGSYYIRVQGSGRQVYLNEENLSTTAQLINQSVPFDLEKQDNGDYHIKSIANQQYLKLDNEGGFILAALPSQENSSFDFYPIRQKDGNFKIKCKANNQFLYEFFDLNFGTQHHQILSSTEQDDDYSLFLLEQNHIVPPDDLSGEYYIRVQGSGRHLNIEPNDGFVHSDNDFSKFLLKRRSNGDYEILEKSSTKNLHASNEEESENWNFTTSTTSGLPENYYRFNLIEEQVGKYKIQSLANDQYLYEFLDWESGPQHHHILSSLEQGDDYSFFLLEQNYVAPPEDLTGEYYIRVQGSGLHLNIVPNDSFAFADNDFSKFLLQRRSNGYYEIIEKLSNKSLHANEEESGDWSYTTANASGLPDNYYRFNLIKEQGEKFKIQSLANDQYLYEFFDLEAGSQHHHILSSNEQADDYNFFLLEQNYIAPPKLNGEYLIRTKNTGRYFNIKNNTFDYEEWTADGVIGKKYYQPEMLVYGNLDERFMLKPKNGGAYYMIGSKRKKKWLHFQIPNKNLNFINDDRANSYYGIFSTGDVPDLQATYYHFKVTETSNPGDFTIESSFFNQYNKLIDPHLPSSEEYKLVLPQTGGHWPMYETGIFNFTTVSPEAFESPIIVDGDNNEYISVSIGQHEILYQNLKTTKYNDGTEIPADLFSWYDDDQSTNKNIYGALYTWDAISETTNGGKNICPIGWHIPTNDEWTNMIASIGGKETYYGRYGFSNVNGGYWDGAVYYTDLDLSGYYWSSTILDALRAMAWGFIGNKFGSRPYVHKVLGYSCRCIKD